MDLKKEENVTLKCPFCGAPQEKTIPVGVVQVKCKYCSGLIVIPPSMSKGAHRCRHHPEKTTSGRCNDCGEYFCDRCLQTYDFITEDGSALLYLCPDCLRGRVLDKANHLIYIGIAALLMGIFSAIIGPPLVLPSAILALIGVAVIADSFLRRHKAPKGTSIDEPQIEEEKKEEPSVALQNGDVEELYSKLLTYYVTRWGSRTGNELLDIDVGVYTRRGVSFAEAVDKVYRREEKNIRRFRI